MWTIYKKERIQKIKKTGDSQFIYLNELGKVCFQHDMVYGDFKDLNRRTASDKAFNIAKNPKYDGYQCGLQWLIFFFDKKTSGGTVKEEKISNKELGEDLHKPVIKKFKKRKSGSPFIDNMWGADLADMQLMSKLNKRIRFLLCLIDICTKYAWVIPLKDKKGITKIFKRI